MNDVMVVVIYCSLFSPISMDFLALVCININLFIIYIN